MITENSYIVNGFYAKRPTKMKYIHEIGYINFQKCKLCKK